MTVTSVILININSPHMYIYDNIPISKTPVTGIVHLRGLEGGRGTGTPRR
jgi:hypothetical protein